MPTKKANFHEVLIEHIQSPKIYGYEDQFDQLYNLVVHTVSTGGSNSVLLLGPRGSGKSRLVDTVLARARAECPVFESGDGLVVRLHGLVDTDDKLALKSIARQLRLENVAGDRVFGSFAEHLEFLLSSLKSGGKESKPVVFVLEEFHLFCAHHNQTLLYNLFDVAQSKAAPMVVIGVSPEMDVLESLEKRVRSRFNHRQINLFPHQEFDEYISMVRDMLTAAPTLTPKWRQNMETLVHELDFSKFFRRLFHINSTTAFLKQTLLLGLILSQESRSEVLTLDNLKDAFAEQMVASEPVILSGLTVIEMCILIAIKRLQVVYEGQPFNFEMAFHEFDKFVATKAKMLKQDRTVAMKAWETLADLELITPVEKSAKIQKEFKLYAMQVLPDDILKSLNSLPQNVKEWATSIPCA